MVKVRVNQSFFRCMVLASYGNKCCITGITIPDLLVASHIIPWSKDEKNRLNPRNGLCLNSFHDKAFDKGYLTLDDQFRIKLSKQILDSQKQEVIKKYFIAYEGMAIDIPKRFLPDLEFLKYHQSYIFLG